MASRVSTYRPTTPSENVKDIPVIKQSPSVDKFSLNTQGNSMAPGKMKAAAIFYVFLSLILFMGGPGMTSGKGNLFRFVVMAALCANFAISINVLHYVNSAGNP